MVCSRGQTKLPGEFQQELDEYLGQLFALRLSVAPVCLGQQITVWLGLLGSHSPVPCTQPCHQHFMPTLQPGTESESVFRAPGEA